MTFFFKDCCTVIKKAHSKWEWTLILYYSSQLAPALPVDRTAKFFAPHVSCNLIPEAFGVSVGISVEKFASFGTSISLITPVVSKYAVAWMWLLDNFRFSGTLSKRIAAHKAETMKLPLK